MKGFVKEINSKKRRPLWQVLLVAFTAIVFLNILITSCNYLGNKYAAITSIGILAGFVVLSSFVVKRLLRSYVYTLFNDKLIFEQVIGNKRDVVLRVELDDIDYIKPYSEIDSVDNPQFTYKFICDKNYNNCYFGDFYKGGRKYRFVFRPSDRLINIINSKVNLNC
ncbi:hypothetical protein [Thermohalobacter berrensis]|uniref:Uncharacterized protein n=1 Tax=Thermohalobacter berrensis TaxID=99594 RepID=A0A419SUI2_9FIRM|nr:hypothetical protein [Thermohalobacter berrensis]RKD28822.1 hypothetical protein BET03_07270 [Thermohalobacter berrensis]